MSKGGGNTQETANTRTTEGSDSIAKLHKIAQGDKDFNYSAEEKEALKSIDKQEVLKDAHKMIDALKVGLVEDIQARNAIWLMKPEMTPLFDASVLPNTNLPTQSDAESDASLSRRTKVVKQLLKNALTGDADVSSKNRDLSKIDSASADRNAEELVALHYFQLLRHIPGKSKPDAICGPLTMKDLLAANGVDLTTQIKEPKDSVFVKYKETPVMLTESEKAKYQVPADSVKVYKLGATILSVSDKGDISEITLVADTPASAVAEIKKESSANQFKEKYFTDEVMYEAFTKTIPTWINIYELAQTTAVNELRHRVNLVDVTIKPAQDGLHITYGGEHLGAIPLQACVETDAGLPTFNKELLKSHILQLVDAYVLELHKQKEVNDRISLGKAFVTDTHYSLTDLFEIKKAGDGYIYEAFIKKFFPSGKITLHPTATKIADEGPYKDKQLWFTLGNYNFDSGYADKLFLYKQAVDLDKVTTKIGSANIGTFDKEKWKPYLATVIKNAVEQYAANSIKKSENDLVIN